MLFTVAHPSNGKVVDVAKPQLGAVQFFLEVIECNIACDLIKMSDFPPTWNGPAA